MIETSTTIMMLLNRKLDDIHSLVVESILVAEGRFVVVQMVSHVPCNVMLVMVSVLASRSVMSSLSVSRPSVMMMRLRWTSLCLASMIISLYGFVRHESSD